MERRDVAHARSWIVLDKPGVELYHVLLTFRAFPEDGQFASYCEELGVHSQGDTIDEALDNAVEATLLYLNTIEDLGERRRIFDEKNIDPERGLPKIDAPEHQVTVVPSQVVTTRLVGAQLVG